MKINREKITKMSTPVTQVAENVVVHPDDVASFLADVNAQAAADGPHYPWSDGCQCRDCQWRPLTPAQQRWLEVEPEQTVGDGADYLSIALPAAEIEQAENWLAGVSRFAKALGGDYETAITVATAIERSQR